MTRQFRRACLDRQLEHSASSNRTLGFPFFLPTWFATLPPSRRVTPFIFSNFDFRLWRISSPSTELLGFIPVSTTPRGISQNYTASRQQSTSKSRTFVRSLFLAWQLASAITQSAIPAKRTLPFRHFANSLVSCCPFGISPILPFHVLLISRTGCLSLQQFDGSSALYFHSLRFAGCIWGWRMRRKVGMWMD